MTSTKFVKGLLDYIRYSTTVGMATPDEILANITHDLTEFDNLSEWWCSMDEKEFRSGRLLFTPYSVIWIPEHMESELMLTVTSNQNGELWAAVMDVKCDGVITTNIHKSFTSNFEDRVEWVKKYFISRLPEEVRDGMNNWLEMIGREL